MNGVLYDGFSNSFRTLIFRKTSCLVFFLNVVNYKLMYQKLNSTTAMRKIRKRLLICFYSYILMTKKEKKNEVASKEIDVAKYFFP